MKKKVKKCVSPSSLQVVVIVLVVLAIPFGYMGRRFNGSPFVTECR